MRYIETLTRERGARLHAPTESQLKSKVASSTRSQHRGYPDEVGYVPFAIADPKHRSHTDAEFNLCSDDDPERATVFTACLGFPHLPLGEGIRRKSIRHLVQTANCDANAVLDAEDDTIQTVLHERERLRMRAVRDGHAYALGGKMTLTADPVDRILITCARAAERRHDEVTADGVRQVLSFKRNTLLRDLPFGLDAITDEFLDDRIGGKTCAPLLPQTEEHREVLLYYIDNPDAPLTDVVEETGISRGQFETFRLNLPDPRCYDREYIASLRFDFEEFKATLHEWMSNSPHDIYTCSECSCHWAYSKRSLAMHKVHMEDHEDNHVLDDECPDSQAAVSQQHTVTETSDSDVDTLLDVFETATGRAARKATTEEPENTIEFDEGTDDIDSEPVADDETVDETVSNSDESDTPVDTVSDETPTDEATPEPEQTPADRVTDADINTQYADKIAEIRAEHDFRGGEFVAKMQDGYGPYAWLIPPTGNGGDWHYLGKVEPSEPEESPVRTDSEPDESPSEDSVAEDTPDIKAQDILAVTDRPVKEIADTLLMSNTEIVEKVLDALSEEERNALRQAFEPVESESQSDPLQVALSQ